MMLVSGELHKKLRSVAVSFINVSKSRPHFLDYVDKMSVSLIDSWKAKRQVFFFKEAKELTFYLMLKNLVSIEPEDPLAAKVLGDFLTFMEGFVSLPLYIPGTAYSKAINARRRISSTLKDVIKRRENMVTGTNVRGDFLDEILANVCLNYEEKVSVLLDLLLAGYETTSGLMALVVYFLAQAPSSLQKLQDEHRAVRKRKKDGKPLNWEDYKNMEFTSHVINEALRCGNLVKFVHRKALKDVKFKAHPHFPSPPCCLPAAATSGSPAKSASSPRCFSHFARILAVGGLLLRLVVGGGMRDPATSRKVTPYGGGLRICPGAELGGKQEKKIVQSLALGVQEGFVAGY
ncbi:hypothetical protein DH2020_027925 [Rehmannia glutinosa]|uniref:Cytochrome P450 protein n=1 Tax=Rehmannia glutinosa TaxID=99300 RepID=A0ABR0VVT2_REHGL